MSQFSSVTPSTREPYIWNETPALGMEDWMSFAIQLLLWGLPAVMIVLFWLGAASCDRVITVALWGMGLACTLAAASMMSTSRRQTAGQST